MHKIALSWPNEGNYARIRQISVDELPDNLADFQANTRRKLAQRGLSVDECVLVDLDPEQLLNWAISKGRPVDANCRAQFAAYVVMTQLERGNRPTN